MSTADSRPLRSTLDVRTNRVRCYPCPGIPLLKKVPAPLLQDALTKQYAELIPSLADLARNLVRDLDPQVAYLNNYCTIQAKDMLWLVVLMDGQPASMPIWQILCAGVPGSASQHACPFGRF